MVNYYFEVMKDNVSICLDSDIGYHHHFKIGEDPNDYTFYSVKLFKRLDEIRNDKLKDLGI